VFFLPLDRRRRLGNFLKLKSNSELESSPIVANSAMNRERNLQGTNSYSKDIGFDILDFLQEQLRNNGQVRWLDLCCGTGKALVQATNLLLEQGFDQVSIVGIDLVSTFDQAPQVPNLRLLEADLSTWTTSDKFDLITCVHGLHYIGDKLDLIGRVMSWLTPDGVFKANLDLKSLRRGSNSSKQIKVRVLKRQGLTYDRATHVLSAEGHRDSSFSQFIYMGADDEAGPNYTLQPAVNSHYKWANGRRRIKRSKAAKKRRAEKRAKKLNESTE